MNISAGDRELIMSWAATAEIEHGLSDVEAILLVRLKMYKEPEPLTPQEIEALRHGIMP
jgi:hypothetical protein